MSHPSRVPAGLTSVRGPVLFADDDGFAEEVAVFNTVVTHKPHVIIGAADATDVVSAVRFGREQDRPSRVPNTGHGPSRSVSPDAVMITTRRMKGVRSMPSTGPPGSRQVSTGDRSSKRRRRSDSRRSRVPRRRSVSWAIRWAAA